MMVILMLDVGNDFFYEGDEVNVYVDVDSEVNVHVGDMMMKMFETMLILIMMLDVNVDNIGVWCSLWCLMFTMMMMMFDVHHDDDVDGWCSLYWCW